MGVVRTVAVALMASLFFGMFVVLSFRVLCMVITLMLSVFMFVLVVFMNLEKRAFSNCQLDCSVCF